LPAMLMHLEAAKQTQAAMAATAHWRLSTGVGGTFFSQEANPDGVPRFTSGR
jgi:hypothetical protein